MFCTVIVYSISPPGISVDCTEEPVFDIVNAFPSSGIITGTPSLLLCSSAGRQGLALKSTLFIILFFVSNLSKSILIAAALAVNLKLRSGVSFGSLLSRGLSAKVSFTTLYVNVSVLSLVRSILSTAFENDAAVTPPIVTLFLSLDKTTSPLTNVNPSGRVIVSVIVYSFVNIPALSLWFCLDFAEMVYSISLDSFPFVAIGISSTLTVFCTGSHSKSATKFIVPPSFMILPGISSGFVTSISSSVTVTSVGGVTPFG